MASKIQLISAEQLHELPPTEILGNTRLIARGLNVVFGASGAFKSFYTLDAALSIAQSAPVIYVAAEGAGGLFKRVSAWCEYNQQSPGQLYFVCEEVNLLNVDSIKQLIEVSYPIKPALIIFDTLARCIPGGDENSAKDMGLAVRNSAVIQRSLTTAIAWIHHTNRADKGERGSGAIRGAADAMIELSANGDSVIRVACSKLKDDEPWVTEELRFTSVGASGVLIPDSLFDLSKLSAVEMQILEFLTLDVFDTVGARVNQIMNALNISERNVYRMLSHLKKGGYISQDTKGDPYSLASKGAQLITKTTGKPASAKVINLVKPTVTASDDVIFRLAPGM